MRKLQREGAQLLAFLRRAGPAAVAGIAILLAIRADGHTTSPPRTKPLPPVLDTTTNELPKTPTADVHVRAGSLPPGSATAWHTHPSPPFVYVVSGTGTWEYKDGQPPEIRRTGQAIMEPANVVVRLVNRGTSPLRMVIFQVSKPGDPVIRPAN